VKINIPIIGEVESGNTEFNMKAVGLPMDPIAIGQTTYFGNVILEA